MVKLCCSRVVILLAILFGSGSLYGGDDYIVGGSIGFSHDSYFKRGQYQEQRAHHAQSFYLNPNLTAKINSEITFNLEATLHRSNTDSEENYFDFDKFNISYRSRGYRLKLGYDELFWGVTEFQHLIDTVNPIVFSEDIRGEAKLGQLMFNVGRDSIWGSYDFYVFPRFDNNIYAGKKGRFRTPIVISNRRVEFQDNTRSKGNSYLFRWSHYIGSFDIGFIWFEGINRYPILSSRESGVDLVQYYPSSQSVGVDLQATLGGWLWKMESFFNETSFFNSSSVQVGFEYIFSGFLGAKSDIGLLIEYGWDTRDGQG